MDIYTGDIIAVVSERLKISVELSKELVDATHEAMGNALARGEHIYIRGLGTWEPYMSPAGKKFTYGQWLEYPAKPRVRFKQSKELKELLKEKYETSEIG